MSELFVPFVGAAPGVFPTAPSSVTGWGQVFINAAAPGNGMIDGIIFAGRPVFISTGSLSAQRFLYHSQDGLTWTKVIVNPGGVLATGAEGSAGWGLPRLGLNPFPTKATLGVEIGRAIDGTKFLADTTDLVTFATRYAQNLTPDDQAGHIVTPRGVFVFGTGGTAWEDSTGSVFSSIAANPDGGGGTMVHCGTLAWGQPYIGTVDGRVYRYDEGSNTWKSVLSTRITAAPTLVASATGGTLASATYFYVITPISQSGSEGGKSAEASVVVTGPTGSVAVSWPASTGAVAYRIYRGTAAGAENVFYVVGTNAFTDTGGTSVAGTPPAAVPTDVGIRRMAFWAARSELYLWTGSGNAGARAFKLTDPSATPAALGIDANLLLGVIDGIVVGSQMYIITAGASAHFIRTGDGGATSVELTPNASMPQFNIGPKLIYNQFDRRFYLGALTSDDVIFRTDPVSG